MTGPELLDGVLANGEIRFEKNGVADPTALRVIAPDTHVDFGVAAIFGNDGVDVSAEATAQVRTPLPPMSNVLPMWLPATCVYGPLAGDIDSQPAPDASPSYTLNSPNGSHETGTVSPSTTVYGSSGLSVTIPITNIASGKTGAVIRFSFGDTKVVDYLATWPVATTSSSNDRTVTVTVGTEVTSTAGTWEVWPLVSRSAAVPSVPPSDVNYPRQQGNDDHQGSFTVTGGGEVSCSIHQRGNFGQLDSPRNDTGQKQTAYALNVALGLDHELAVFQNPASYECHGDDSPAGALIDNRPLDGRNCLYVDPGNDPVGLTKGLLDGVNGYPGRLRATEPSACGRTNKMVSGVVVNDDTLSCYLKPGFSLADIAKDDGVPEDALDASIYDSPRLFWVPVVYAGDRMLKKYLAIKTFAPVFLTDETILSDHYHSDASSMNGLALNPAGKVQSVQLFGFNADALPVLPNAQTQDFQEGARKVVRLVD